MRTLDDFIDLITLSDKQRIQMIRDFAAAAVDDYIKDAVDDSLFDILIRNRMSDFIPETYIHKLDSVITKEQGMVSSLYSDIARIQTKKEPSFYLEHLTDEDIWDKDGNSKLWVATEIGLHIYLSESIMTYAREVRGNLISLSIRETKKNYYHNIILSPDECEDIYLKFKTRGLINADCSLDEFQYFFVSQRRIDEPKNKIQWKGSIIDLVCFILILSHGFPEWTVTQKAFGVDSDKLKSTASRLKKSVGYKKKICDFKKKYLI